MKLLAIIFASAFISTSCVSQLAEAAPPVRTWSFDVLPARDETKGAAKGFLEKGGRARAGAGVTGQSLVLSGRSLLEVKDSGKTVDGRPPFSMTIWFNPYNIDRGQQMIFAKNRYSLGERQWGLMVDDDGKLRFYVYQRGWKTVHAAASLKPGHWHQAGVVVNEDGAQLWLNGKLAGQMKLTDPIPQTNAPLTFGGVDDNGRIRQNFMGALDEAALFDLALTPKEMASLYKRVSTVHEIPTIARPVRLWDERRPLPVAKEITALDDVEFHVIKQWDQKKDGYTFLHGVGLGWHRGKLYASIGHNRGAENTVTEEAQYRVSEDNGKSWGPLKTIDAGDEDHLAISHGVFLSHQGKLWAFHGAYHNKMQDIHTRAYTLDEQAGVWKKRGVVVGGGFWPMNQPLKMASGNWIMPGMSAGPYSNSRVFPAAVAISSGDDLTKWRLVQIPTSDGIERMWGESAVIVDSQRILNIARYGGGAAALLATSEDYGETWTPSRVSNLPMATSKPAAGTLSTGQRYLICTTAKNNGGRRSPLTIAVSRPGESLLSKVFVVRRSRHEAAGESADQLSLAYPCAVEHEGHLYIGYSNNGGRRGNLNSAELAIVPIKSLSAED